MKEGETPEQRKIAHRHAVLTKFIGPAQKLPSLRHLDISKNRLSLYQLINLIELIEGPPHASLEVLKI